MAIDRAALGGNNSAVLPDDYSSTVIQLAEQSSAVLSLARREQMSGQVLHQPVMAEAPRAKWVGGDTDKRPAGKAKIDDAVLTARELATIVTIPKTVWNDASIDVFEVISPKIAESIGRAVDEAVLFGINTPAGFPAGGLVGMAEKKTVGGTGADKDTKTHIIEADPKTDLAARIAQAGELLADTGLDITGFASAPGLHWKLRGLRAEGSGVPIYQPALTDGGTPTLYGMPIREVKNGSFDKTKATLIAADWNLITVGVRQDIEAVKSEDAVVDGVSMFETNQIALKVTFRVAAHIAEPYTPIGSDDKTANTAFPAIIVK
ncbi:phage major capsid protein [Nocardia terpenica]|uniref:Phage major capsid protein n=1 Tax=Nocardia terpenica TaxID=455432 RepID=A0A291RCB6_9NOCA|nr:phage major capsid protein [Nocardia terpenica]ATL64938.1 phage major capsid protein [Nocardia terpenica]